MRIAGIMLLVAAAGLIRAASEPVARPVFAVVSVKPNRGSCCTTYGVGNGGGGGKYVTVRTLIAFAWRRQQFEVVGGPKWIGTERFDVDGKAEDSSASYDQLRLMLRSPLEDRFKLHIHTETRQQTVYALMRAKGGLKMKRSADQESGDINGPAPRGAGPNRGAIRMGSGTLAGNAVKLSLLANMLSQRLDHVVIDRTNLPGRWDVSLGWAPSMAENPLDAGGSRLPASIIGTDGTILAADSAGPQIFTAIQEQLGLKLQSQRAPVDVLAIDSIERPSAN